jgi:hypothetical protein
MEVSACPAARVCGMCLRMLSVSLSLWLEKVVGMGNGQARRKTRKRSCSARHAPRNARLSYACAVADSSLLLWCERAMLLTPKVGLLDDPSVLLEWGMDGCGMDIGGWEWMDAEWMDGGTEEEDEK